MSKRIGIVGSRPPPRGAPQADVDLFDRLSRAAVAFVEDLPRDTVVVSGGADGIDTVAIATAKRLGLGWVEYPPLAEEGDARFHIRNQRVVDASAELVAFPTPWSKGTWDTVRRAKARNISVQILRGDA